MSDLLYERILWYAILNVFMLTCILLLSPLRFKKRNCIAFAFLVLLSIACLDSLRFAPSATSGNWHYVGITVIEIIIVQGFAVGISKYRDGRSLFTGLSASNLVLTGYILGIVAEAFTGNIWLNVLVSSIINILLLLFMAKVIRKPYLLLQQKGKSGWLALCLIPVFYYLLFFFLTSVPYLLIDKPFDIPAALCAVCGMVVSYVVAINYVSRRIEEDEVLRNKALLESYMKSLSMESATIEAAQGELRILRHDLRHYLRTISVMLDEGNYGDIKEIIGQADVAVDKTEVPIYCDHPILNSTLQSLALKADREGVALNSSILMGAGDEMPYIEFSAVIANLVENAIEATARLDSGEKTVSILMQPVKGQLVVEVTNPTDDRVPIQVDTGLPDVDPSENGIHGIGLKSVKEFVERNQGAFYCSCENYRFVARLSVPQHQI